MASCSIRSIKGIELFFELAQLVLEIQKVASGEDIEFAKNEEVFVAADEFGERGVASMDR